MASNDHAERSGKDEREQLKHPIQPLGFDDRGVLRFKENRLVQFILDNCKYDLNQLAAMNFPAEDREQLAQLIGYSLSGFCELHYVRNDTYGAAEAMAERANDEDAARIAYLEECLRTVRNGLRAVVPAVFRVAAEDLEEALGA